jgi:transposase, IS5 family
MDALGVTTVVIPRKGKPGNQRRQLERSRPFRRLVKWRTGSEGRVAQNDRRRVVAPFPARPPAWST